MVKVGKLPPIAPAALQLIRLLGQEESDRSDILTCLKHDPALTAGLLRLCNSAALGLKDPVVSVDQALLLLGHRRLHELVLQVALGDSLSVPLPGYAIEARTLWRHSVVTARIAEQLAERQPEHGVAPDVAFTAGLLHDVGKLVLADILDPPRVEAIRCLVHQEDLDRSEAERRILGVDHAEVGAELLRRWNIPPFLVHAVQAHHQPCLRCQPPLCSVTHLADGLAHVLGANAGWESLATRVNPAAERLWQLEATEVEALLLDLAEHLNSLEKTLNPR
ncbi:MAG: HDOD domain-containing protein [Verrucomicrobiota bacterium]|nr:HDOD domain-containing protein [Limisphaera sp.]MDW8380893.1 HDOD domain-containing protein [Verrucomicrobiota bacterium]